MPHLRLASGNGPAEWFPLQGERVVVGRSRDCDLILPDVLLSRRHVELVRSAEGWLGRDLGSLNGTRLNGEMLVKPRAPAPPVLRLAGPAARVV